MTAFRFTICSIGLALCANLACGQDILKELEGSRPTATATDHTVSVSTTQAWTDTKLDLQPGDQLTITATNEKSCNPQGVSGGKASSLPLASATPGALIAKLQENATPQLVGNSAELKADAAGHLYLGVNGTSVCSGSFSVSIHQQAQSQGDRLKSQLGTAAQIFLQGQLGNGASSAASGLLGGTAAATPNTVAALKVSDDPLDASLRKDIDGLPRRVNDQFKNMGDMVNFVLIGSEKQVQDTLAAANWHPADTSDTKAALNAIVDTYQNKDYLAMPMSTLYLFGRPQDFGYEEAEPIAMVASRHHFRIWKAPFTWDGQTVWAGAGTHDIGFAKDKRNGNVTHKIDPNLDGERTNIGQTLSGTGKVKSLSYYLPANPVLSAKNATGDGYTSDGKILVVMLK